MIAFALAYCGCFLLISDCIYAVILNYLAMGRRTTVKERNLIITHFRNGHSQRKIAKMVNKCPSTVQHIIERYSNENRLENKSRVAPNKIFNYREERWIIREMAANPTKSAPKLRDEVEKQFGKRCNPETIRRVLRKNNLSSLPETFVPGFHDEAVVRRMPYAPLGSTGLNVSRISLGTAGFSYFYGDFDIEECKKTVHEAIKNGVNYIDTAPWYGHGESERILGLCLEGIPRKAYYLATKCCRYEKDPKLMFDFTAERTRKSIEESLSRLKLDYVDLLQCHDVEYAPSIDMVLNETLPAVQEIVDSGKAKYIGVTGYPVNILKELVEKAPVPIDTVLSYSRYTMIDNTLSEYFPFFESRNMGVINAAVTAMGLLTNNGPPIWHSATSDIKETCQEAADHCKQNGIELGKLAVYDGLQQNEPHTLLIGMNSRTLLDYNLDVLRKGLTEKEEQAYQEVKKILSKLPAQSHWENIELEKYRRKIAA